MSSFGCLCYSGCSSDIFVSVIIKCCFLRLSADWESGAPEDEGGAEFWSGGGEDHNTGGAESVSTDRDQSTEARQDVVGGPCRWSAETGGRVGRLPRQSCRGGLSSYWSRWEGRALTPSLVQGWGSTPIEADGRVGHLPCPLYRVGSVRIKTDGRVGHPLLQGSGSASTLTAFHHYLHVTIA